MVRSAPRTVAAGTPAPLGACATGARKDQDGGASPGPAGRGAGLRGGSVMRRLPGAGDIGWGSYRPRAVAETAAGRLVAHAGVCSTFSGIRRAVPAGSRSRAVIMSRRVRFRTPGRTRDQPR